MQIVVNIFDVRQKFWFGMATQIRRSSRKEILIDTFSKQTILLYVLHMPTMPLWISFTTLHKMQTAVT